MGALSYPIQIPEQLNAAVPSEYKGGARDQVKLMVLDSETGSVTHDRFPNIVDFLNEDDVLIMNNSRTIPAVLKAKQGESEVEIRLSRKVSSNKWDALLLGKFIQTNAPLQLEDGVRAEITGSGSEAPLVTLAFSLHEAELLDFIYRYGEPIRYEYIDTPWQLDLYQTVYASVPGSVEMPSAGRAFSWRVLNKLKEKGVGIGYLQLHAGISYYENDQWPNPTEHPEEYNVPDATAELINRTRKKGGRVIAVGTTVVRALESVVNDEGVIEASSGLTRLYVDNEYKIKSVDGLITGLHEPEASHLDMLTAFVDQDKLMNAYRDAVQQGYLWHEFGDINLILPGSVEK